MVQPKSRTSASKPAPARCASERLTDLALASRSEIRIICTAFPPADPVPSKPLPNIDRILSADDELQPVLAKTRDLHALGGFVDGFFPPDLARQVRVANFREGELVLTAGNPAVAAKIKLLGPSLCRFCDERRWQVSSVSVRVQPTPSGVHKSLPALQKNAKFSSPGLTALEALYRGLQDSPAREALRVLLARQGVLPPKEPEDARRTGAAGTPPRRKARP